MLGRPPHATVPLQQVTHHTLAVLLEAFGCGERGVGRVGKGRQGRGPGASLQSAPRLAGLQLDACTGFPTRQQPACPPATPTCSRLCRCGWLLPSMSPVVARNLLRYSPAVRPPSAEPLALPLPPSLLLPSLLPSNDTPGRDPAPHTRRKCSQLHFGAPRAHSWPGLRSPKGPSPRASAVERWLDLRLFAVNT